MHRNLNPLREKLHQSSTVDERLQVLHQEWIVKDFFLRKPDLAWEMGDLSAEEEVAFKSVVAIGQGDIVFRMPDGLEPSRKRLRRLLAQLVPVEAFYRPLGGIVGYHQTIIELLEGLPPAQGRTYTHPPAIDLMARDCTEEVRWGIEALPLMAEIYPIGGAGDRLGLVDEETGEPLPAACLPFGGRTLLEGMIRDLQAREYLYYKLTGEEVVTPIAMMTSHEKRNDQRVRAICEKQAWFGRPRESFRFFPQCLVPVVTDQGNWALSDPLTPVLKPGGHGVIWKHMLDAGIFHWLSESRRTHALVRQINNPVCGVDDGLLVFTGIGVHGNKSFGFAACHRRVGTAEGVDVLVEQEGNYCLTCVEYTDFAREGIEDAPVEPGSPYSKFPANTNILCVGLEAVQKAVEGAMLPAPLINMKHKAPFIDAQGRRSERFAGRLESTMQNLADQFWAESPEALPTYLTDGRRQRTISVTKKLWKEGEPIEETPEGAWQTHLANARELLAFCQIEVGERFHYLAHPALGPLYAVIAQKLRGGKLHEDAELQLEIAEAEIVNLDLDGSLCIEAHEPLRARCRLVDVVIRNRGVDWDLPWANRARRRESLRIELHGSGEFEARGVTFDGPHSIKVPDGVRIVAKQERTSVRLHSQPIAAPTWEWEYSWAGEQISLAAKSRPPPDSSDQQSGSA